MKKQPRLAPVFLAAAVALSAAAPAPLLAQVVGVRPVAVPVAPSGAAGAAARAQIGSVAAPLGSVAAMSPALTAPASVAPSLAASVIAAPAVSAAAAPARAAAVSAATAEAKVIRAPGAAASTVASEAAAHAAQPADFAPVSSEPQEDAQPHGFGAIISRLTSLARGRSSAAKSFDGGLGLREQKPGTLPNGSALDEEPPAPTLADYSPAHVNAFHLAGEQPTTLGGPRDSAVTLDADPANPDAVVAAIKALIDADPAYYGVRSADLQLVHAKAFEGQAAQANSIFVYFHHTKDGIVVDKSNLSFTVMVENGRPVVRGYTNELLPTPDVETGATLSNDEIMRRIAEKTGLSTDDAADKFKFLQEKLIRYRGEWRHVKLYVADGLPFMVAVDMNNGLVFAWSNRAGVASGAPSAAAPQGPVPPASLSPLKPGNWQLLADDAAVAQTLPSWVRAQPAGEPGADGQLLSIVKTDGSSFTDAELTGLTHLPGVRGARNLKSSTLPRSSTLAAGPKGLAGIVARVVGLIVDKGPQLPGAQLANIPLAFLNIAVGGKTYVTDKDGKFKADALEIGAEGLELTADLAGPYVRIEDQERKTLSLRVTVKNTGEELQVVFNPDASLGDENGVAQVMAFRTVNRALNFLRVRKLTTAAMDKLQLPVRTNIDDECNAYYTPGSASENFFKSSKNCVNSSYDTVAQHETGHYWDDFTGGITNGGLSEGWGDILSMFDLNNPVIGEHFLKHPRATLTGLFSGLNSARVNRADNGSNDARTPVDYIRHGENTYQYNEYDEVHDQGQAWMGFAWKLRKALIAKLGYEAGSAMAESLIMPTMFAKASTIPNAIAQVLINATSKDGSVLHEAEIRAAAKTHGIDLPQRPKRSGPEGPSLMAAGADEGAGAARSAGNGGIAAMPATIRFTAGVLFRGRVKNAIRRYLDEQTDITYDLKEYRGWLSSDFLLVIEGPDAAKRKHSRAIREWLKSQEN